MADYPITSVARRIVYTGSAGVGPYAFSFPVLTSTDIAVYKNTTLLTLTTDYTVTISGTTGTGSVTLVSAATGSDTITIVGARAIQRSTDFVTGGDFFANTLNTELDSEVIFAQQVAETAERAIKAPVTDPTNINMTLPSKSARLGCLLLFDEVTGNPIAGPNGSEIAAVANNANAIQDAKDLCTLKASEASTSATSAAASATAAATSATSAAASATAASTIIASGMYSSVQDKSIDYTIVAGDAGDLIRVNTSSGQRTITLPLISSVPDGFNISVVKWTGDANSVVILRSGTNTINGITSYTISSIYNSVTFVADYETNTWFAAGTGTAGTNITVNNFSGNGSTTTFTLSYDPATENNTYVYISGVYQSKANYAVSGTSLIFNTPPASGTNNIEVMITQPLAIGSPSDGTVSIAKMTTGHPTWTSGGYVGINTPTPLKELHTTSALSTGATWRFENSNTAVVSGDIYGTIDWYGNDSSANANGVRASIYAESSGTTGATLLKLRAAGAGSTALGSGMQVSSTGVTVPGGLTANGSFQSNGNTFLSGYVSTINNVKLTGYVSMTAADTQVDVDLTFYVGSAAINAMNYIRVALTGVYIDNTATPTFAGSARAFKEWNQGVVYNGTTWVILGASLIGTGYSSDATNWPLGAVNASKFLLVVSTTQVLLRIQNRTTPGASSGTGVTYDVTTMTTYY